MKWTPSFDTSELSVSCSGWCSYDEFERTPDGVRVHIASSHHVGSCNFCRKRIPHDVLVVESHTQTLQVRFCRDCFSELKKVK